MEHQLWPRVEESIERLRGERFRPRAKYSDATIVRVYYWAAMHDRPVCWACDRRNWPLHAGRQPLPSPPTMSRRLRSPSVIALLDAIEQAVVRPAQAPLVHCLDGKPLPIGGCSKDRQAGYGRAAGGMAKGYKMHALVAHKGTVTAWRIAPMNVDERVMARRILRQTSIAGYVLGDANYDDNKTHAICETKGNLQLLTPRRYGNQKGLGHHKQNPGRLRSIERLYGPMPLFARNLWKGRSDIERYFGNLTSWSAGLTHLPPWVRTYRRVRRWVQAKLVLNRLRIQLRQRTYVAA